MPNAMRHLGSVHVFLVWNSVFEVFVQLRWRTGPQNLSPFVNVPNTKIYLSGMRACGELIAAAIISPPWRNWRFTLESKAKLSCADTAL